MGYGCRKANERRKIGLSDGAGEGSSLGLSHHEGILGQNGSRDLEARSPTGGNVTVLCDTESGNVTENCDIPCVANGFSQRTGADSDRGFGEPEQTANESQRPSGAGDPRPVRISRIPGCAEEGNRPPFWPRAPFIRGPLSVSGGAPTMLAADE